MANDIDIDKNIGVFNSICLRLHKVIMSGSQEYLFQTYLFVPYFIAL
jgi:hypothetical protein